MLKEDNDPLLRTMLQRRDSLKARLQELESGQSSEDAFEQPGGLSASVDKVRREMIDLENAIAAKRSGA
jgi:hypothetical protein